MLQLICDRIEDGVVSLSLADDPMVKFALPQRYLVGIKSGDYLDVEVRINHAATEAAMGEAGRLLEGLKE